MVTFDYYKSLSNEERKKFRDRVIQETGIAYTTFFYKIRYGKWRKSEEKIINDILEQNDHA